MSPPRTIGGLLLLGSLAGALTWGCQQRQPPAEEEKLPGPWFADVTDECGLDFVHDAGPTGTYFMPQAIGSGAALFDYDGDGRLDIYLVQNGGPNGARNRLFHQEPDGRFKDVSEGSGLDVAGYGMGVAIGDVNNDGRPDVLVTECGRVRLFLNNGNGTFTDITEEAGLHNPAWGVSAAFFDYDRDGWLDLVVVNYVDHDPSWPCSPHNGVREYCGPSTFPPQVTKLFHNLGRSAGPQGHGVRFADVTVRSGLGSRPAPGLGVVCTDVNGDGWPDIFISNDGKANHLWINQKDGTFKEEAVERGVAFNALGNAQAGMGVGLGDVDGDGLLDLYVTHNPEEYNTLWQQGPPGLFRDRTAALGLSRPRWRGTGFGTFLGDFDNDGWLDVAVVNGRIAKAGATGNAALGPYWGLYAERNQLFANDGAGHFRDISPASPDFCGTANVARGLAVGDVNGDGGLDLLVTTIAGRARLLRNVAPNRGHWLLLRAVDPALKRDAYGAVVRVRAGERCWVRPITAAGSHLCSSDPRAHFGLGAVERVDCIEVVWPDGGTETFPGGGVDCQRVLARGESGSSRGGK
jgi:hypothetical protein